MVINWALGVLLTLAAFAASIGGVLLLTFLDRQKSAKDASIFAGGVDDTIFLFDGETLIDASARARALLQSSSLKGSPWQKLMAMMAPRFPGLAGQIDRLPTLGRFVLESGTGGTTPAMTFTAEWQGGLSRISLQDPEGRRAMPLIDPLVQRTMEEELRLLRGTIAKAPLPIWLENNESETIWANTAYLDLVTRFLGKDVDFAWPLPRVMEINGDARQRVAMRTFDNQIAWYEATIRPASHGRMIFAQPVDAMVQAEQSLREFTQTLTKTFAQLPIGLAIFDQERRMAIFNPALVDLTRLPPEFLSAKPTLFDFLDKLRECQVVPEPDDYRTWRKRIVDLERDATAGQFEETWNMAGNQILRVLGQPHPDGAMALLFEDISNEMVRHQRYRADVELGQNVIDAMDEAVAVLSSAGALVLTNAAYAKLWGHDPTHSLTADTRIAGLIKQWRSRTAPSPIWDRAQEFVSTFGPRENWAAEARMDDGRLLSFRFVALRDGSTLVACRPDRAESRVPGEFVSSRSRQSA